MAARLRTTDKVKIWLLMPAEVLPILIEMAVLFNFVLLPHGKKESPYGFRRDTALLDALIEPDDIFVLVRQERPFGCHIEGDHTGTEKRLNPSPLPFHWTVARIKGISFVLMPCHLMGGTIIFPCFMRKPPPYCFPLPLATGYCRQHAHKAHRRMFSAQLQKSVLPPRMVLPCLSAFSRFPLSPERQNHRGRSAGVPSRGS